MVHLFVLISAALAHSVWSTQISTCSPFQESRWQCPPIPLMEADSLRQLFMRCLTVIQRDDFVAQVCGRHQTLANAAAREGCTMYHRLDSIAALHAEEYALNASEHAPSLNMLDKMHVLVQLLQLGIAARSAEGTDTDEGHHAMVAEATACYASMSAYKRETFSHAATTNAKQISTDPVNLKSVRFMSAQLEYLVEKARKHELYVWPQSARSEFRSHESLIRYLQALKGSADVFLEGFMEPTFQQYPDYSWVLGGNPQVAQITPFHYNRRVYMRPFPALTPHFSALNPNPSVFLPRGVSVDNFDGKGTLENIDRLYRDEGVVVLDDFLDDEVIEELYHWALESSIWHVTEKHRYVGSYWNDGFAHPYLLAVAREVQQSYPFLANLSLTQMWAYNYHFEEVGGITLHADAALVNVNLWVTVDDANLDPESGGLVVYTKPLTGQETFQQVQDPAFGYEHLADNLDRNYTIPYRQNRVTIFNSALYHETDRLSFKKEFSKRRINFTFLFGEGKYAASAN